MKIDQVPRKSLRFPRWIELLRNQIKGTDEKVEQLHPLLDLLEPSEEEAGLAQTLVGLLTSVVGSQSQQERDLARLLQLVTALAREQQQSRAVLERLANQWDTPLD